MCTHGGMGLSSDILGYPKASTALVRAVVGFMRNLCADDMRKENLGEQYDCSFVPFTIILVLKRIFIT